MLSKIKTILLISVCAFFISSCGTLRNIVIDDQKPVITRANKPSQPNLENIQLITITDIDYQEKLNKISNDGKFAAIVMTNANYAKLLQNILEIERYLKEHKSIIIYYESFLYDEEEQKEE